MRGKRVSTNWHPRACAGKTIPDSCNVKRNFENIVLIDVDCDDFDEVIIIDVPEAVQEKLRGAGVPQKNRGFPNQGVISIDDDDDNGDVELPGPSVAGVGESDGDATPSRTPSPSSNLGESADSDADECCVVPEECCALKSSRSKNSYSGEGEIPCRNRYGLSPVSEDVSFDSDFSDCEVVEDPSGKLREQWENAFSKRKHDTFNMHLHSEDQVKASGLHTDACMSEEDYYSSNPACSSSRNAKAKEKFSSGEGFPVNLGVGHDHDEPSLLFSKDRANRQHNSVGKESKCMGKSVLDNITPARDIPDESDQGRSSVKEQSSLLKSKIGSETFADGERDAQAGDGLQNKRFRSNNSVPDELVHERTVPHKENLSGKPLVPKSCHTGKVHVDCGAKYQVGDSKDTSSSVGQSGVRSAMACHDETAEQLARRTQIVEEEDLVAKSASSLLSREEKDCSHAQDGDCVPSVQKDIINGREMLKETDEYKRAEEAEWASRQRQLQLQAEEVQRLRKKRRAENMRLLDMERRQKQRIEEMRQTQKKDEENMNLKEQLRAEIRKEITKLEITCTDMASLLRGLGIHIGGGLCPLPQEASTHSL
ncbi:uncharacterized protein LOC115750549 isoform X2 [Rhodamnia argentea]|uniref:Uncharacterized protein LOC115750549 isoform X2 n=1 Tax=Rhodamnia argentea TaxID=178133 RepID=A0ABM3HCV6_9MYRT|nr:uncharacterized protein LOC115750549 isoform X2 [Rhodamnia argentea]